MVGWGLDSAYATQDLEVKLGGVGFTFRFPRIVGTRYWITFTFLTFYGSRHKSARKLFEKPERVLYRHSGGDNGSFHSYFNEASISETVLAWRRRGSWKITKGVALLTSSIQNLHCVQRKTWFLFHLSQYLLMHS